MATVVELTQVQLAPTYGGNGGGPTGVDWVRGSEQPLNVDRKYIIGVGPYWDVTTKKIIPGISVLYIGTQPQPVPITVTDSAETIIGYMEANL
jgi:hypothetical protein